MLVPSLSFSQASVAIGLPMAPGDYTIGIAQAGQPSTIVARFGLTAARGARTFVVAAGSLDPQHGQGFRLLTVDTNASPWTVASATPR